MTGALLKEAVDDLEWASGGSAVQLHMRRDPPLVTLSAHGAGDLKITLPVRNGAHCAARAALWVLHDTQGPACICSC